MRLTVCVLTILLSGCQSLALLEVPADNARIPIMPLWEKYQQCLTSTNVENLVMMIGQFEHATQYGTEPPFWMRALGPHVLNQPVRTAVHPQALGAACTLRVAALLADEKRFMEARALYQRLVTRYSDSDWAYYIEKAKEALVTLSDAPPATSAPALLAQRTD